MKIILASASPRRKELMDLMEVPYQVIPSQFDEKRDESLEPEKQVEKLAYGKAKDVLDRTTGDRIIIGSDTLVYKDVADSREYGVVNQSEIKGSVMTIIRTKRF